MTDLPIFIDHHATAPLWPEVIAVMQPYLQCVLPRHENEYVLAEARHKLANLIGAPAAGITFTSGATEANNLAILGLAHAHAANTERRDILVSAIEHDSILEQADALQNSGFVVHRIPVTSAGFVDPAVVADMVSDQTLLVSVMWVNHEIGTIQPIAKIAAIAKSVGAFMHTDATQAVGKIPVNVAEAGIDLLSFSAHKMGGPQGIGVLYARQTPPLPIARILQGGAQQKLRPGTIPLGLVAGFGKSAEISLFKMKDIEVHRAACAEAFLSALAQEGIPFKLNGAEAPRLEGSLNIRFAGVSADDLLLRFAKDIVFSSGAACQNGRPSNVLAAIGLSPEEIAHSVRVSFGHGNTVTQAAKAAANIAAFIKQQT